MVSGEHGDHGIGISPCKNRARDSDSIGRVATLGLTDQVAGRQLGNLRRHEGQVRLVRDNVDLLRCEAVGHALERLTQQARAVEESKHLFGTALATERPQPYADATGHDYTVSHCSSSQHFRYVADLVEIHTNQLRELQYP